MGYSGMRRYLLPLHIVQSRIPRNPAAHTNKPKVRQEEMEPLDAEQARTCLDAARGDRYEALYLLCLMAGRRQGEALGLKWSDIDLDAGTLRVNRQLQRVRRDGEKSGQLVFSEPKNASRRTVGLPQRAVEALRSHRKRQLEEEAKGTELRGLRVRIRYGQRHSA
jgi:integrase